MPMQYSCHSLQTSEGAPMNSSLCPTSIATPSYAAWAGHTTSLPASAET